MENKKLTWEEILKRYDQEWVQLVDYNWPDGEPYPHDGVVRTHDLNKKEFHKRCREGNVPDDSALIFVGHKKSLDNSIFAPSLIRFEPCER